MTQITDATYDGVVASATATSLLVIARSICIKSVWGSTPNVDSAK